MKVLLITQGSPHEEPTGVKTYVRDLADGLADAGWDIARLWVSERSWRPSPRVRWSADHGAQAASLVNSPLVWSVPSERPLEDVTHPVVGSLLNDILGPMRPDLIHIHDLGGIPAAFIPAARLCGVPVIMTLHDFWPFCRQLFLVRPGLEPCEGSDGGRNCALYCAHPASGLRRLFQHLEAAAPSPRARSLLRRSVGLIRTLRRHPRSQFIVPPPRSGDGRPEAVLAATYGARELLMRHALLQATRLLAVSEFVKSTYIRHGYPADRIHVMPLATQATARVRWRQRTFRGYPVRFGYLGRVTPIKGAHILAQAVREIPPEQGEFLVYGSADEEDRHFLSTLAGPSPRLQFKGRYAQNQLGAILERLDVLILPSVLPETQGLVGFEAQAAGLPMIAANHGAIPEYVHHERNGLLFSPGSAPALRAQILRVIHEPEIIARLSANVEPPKPMAEHVGEVMRVYDDVIRQAEAEAAAR